MSLVVLIKHICSHLTFVRLLLAYGTSRPWLTSCKFCYTAVINKGQICCSNSFLPMFESSQSDVN